MNRSIGSRGGASIAKRLDFGVKVMSALLLLGGIARAQTTQPAYVTRVGIDQKLDAQVPGDLVFTDESGASVRLGDYFGSRPIVLSLVYYKCPMLCTMVLNDLTNAMISLPADMTAGGRFDVITVSFDPRETPDLAAKKKRQYLREYHRGGAEHGWHFLTGTQDSIRKLTAAVGFRYYYDPKFEQYVHASGIMVLTPGGRISRYFYGIDYRAKDLRLALAEAASGTISASPVEEVLLYCFHYDPSTGRYSVAILRLMRVAAVLTMIAIGLFWFVAHRRRKHSDFSHRYAGEELGEGLGAIDAPR